MMRTTRASARELVGPVAVAFALLGCGGDGGTAPRESSERQQRRFAALADSLERAGDPDRAEAMRAMSDLVELVGRVGTVQATIDGAAVPLSAIALQFAAPESACEDPSNCVYLERPLRVILAWSDPDVDRALAFLTNGDGSVPLAGPTFVPGDGGSVPGDDPVVPPVMTTAAGVYAETASERVWLATGGTVGTSLQGTTGSCPPLDRAPPEVQYTCDRADFAFSTTATLDEVLEDGTLGGARRQLVVTSEVIPGAAFTATSLQAPQIRGRLTGAVWAAVRAAAGIDRR